VYIQACRQGLALIGKRLDVFSLRNPCFSFRLLTLVFVAGVRPAVAAPIDINKNDMDSLRRGEILLEKVQKEKPGAAARVTALFDSSVTEVWNIIGYCKYEFIYVKGLLECEALESELANMRVRHRLRNSWYSPTLDYTFEANRAWDGNGEVHLLEGDLKVLEGLWKLMPVKDGKKTIVMHEIRIQPGFPAPKWLIRRSLAKDLPDMMACIRGLAGGSGDENRIMDDLERCPGKIPDTRK